jgi:putative transposase
MREFIVLLVHSIATLVQLAKPGGLRSVVAESVLVRHQLLVLNRGRKRAPNLRPADRIIAGLCTLFIRPSRLLRAAIVLRPATLLYFHKALTKTKVPFAVLAKTPTPTGATGTRQRTPSKRLSR